jgi:hypothetical protein
MRFSLRILDVSLDQLRDGFTVESGGRMRIS